MAKNENEVFFISKVVRLDAATITYLDASKLNIATGTLPMLLGSRVVFNNTDEGFAFEKNRLFLVIDDLCTGNVFCFKACTNEDIGTDLFTAVLLGVDDVPAEDDEPDDDVPPPEAPRPKLGLRVIENSRA